MEDNIFTPSGELYHTVYRFTQDLYKVVQWKSEPCRFGPGPRDQFKHSDVKLDPSVSRSKRLILELALCNTWDYFCSFTLDESKWVRSDLHTWAKAFTQYLRDQRKKGFDIAYLLMPERHGDGSWHMHGLFRGLPLAQLVSFKQLDKDGYRSPNGRRLPLMLRESSYFNWMPCMEKFGYCSVGPIGDPVATGFYCTKYMTKDLSRCVSQVSAKMYYASQHLNRPEWYAEFYDRHPAIDHILTNNYEWCRTGFARNNDDYDAWDLDFQNLDAIDQRLRPRRLLFSDVDTPASREADAWHDAEQLTFFLR